MRRYSEGRVYVVECDGAGDLDNRREQRTNYQNIAMNRSYQSDWSASWAGGTQAEITDALLRGWPEGLERVTQLADELRGQLHPPTSFRRRGRWADDGDEPSWEREQAGKDEIWRTARRATMLGPTTVHLLGPWVHSSFQRAENIQWNGVVLAVLCDLLENAGYRVAATLVNSIKLSDGFLAGLVHVKEFAAPLDLASLVPVVAHPGVYRWHGISMATLAPVYCGIGHGLVVPMTALPAKVLPPNSIQLRTVYSRDAATQEIQRVLDMFKHGHPANPLSHPLGEEA